jgi:hypothetical protein
LAGPTGPSGVPTGVGSIVQGQFVVTTTDAADMTGLAFFDVVTPSNTPTYAVVTLQFQNLTTTSGPGGASIHIPAGTFPLAIRPSFGQSFSTIPVTVNNVNALGLIVINADGSADIYTGLNPAFGTWPVITNTSGIPLANSTFFLS